jgi:hypothetical protein
VRLVVFDEAKATGHYELAVEGLGRRFLYAYRDAIEQALAHPGSGVQRKEVRTRHNTLRKFHLRHFPYTLVTVVVGDELRVIAVAHQRRYPGYWAQRLRR